MKIAKITDGARFVNIVYMLYMPLLATQSYWAEETEVVLFAKDAMKSYIVLSIKRVAFDWRKHHPEKASGDTLESRGTSDSRLLLQLA